MNQNSECYYHSNVEPIDSIWYWRLKENEERFHFMEFDESYLKDAKNLGLWHPIHISDYVRLRVLYDFGGLYTDNDVICIKNIEKIWNGGDKPVYPIELEMDHKFGSISNGIMYHPKHSDWTKMCIDFYDDYEVAEQKAGIGHVDWVTWSILRPTEAYLKDKSKVIALSHGLNDPVTWQYDLRRSLFFHDRLGFEDCYTVHLSEGTNKNIIEFIDIEHIMTVDTSFTRIARPFIKHLWDEKRHAPKVSLFE
jgi:hypothetical protein